MAVPVKVSDRLLALARQEAQSTHRSATAQIEHWATLGRAVEAMLAYRDVLALKRAGQSLPVPAHVRPQDVEGVLAGLAEDAGREEARARIRASGAPLYAGDPRHPGRLVEIREDGTRRSGHLEGRRFVPAGGRRAARRK